MTSRVLGRFAPLVVLLCSTAFAVDTTNFDRSQKLSENFYLYTNGSWLKNHPIPPAYNSWDTFQEVNLRVETQLRQIMEKAAAHRSQDALEQKVGAFFASGMNTAEIEAAGLKPLESYLHKIDAIKSKEDLSQLTADFHRIGVSGLFAFGSEQDPKDSEQMIGATSQSGLSLPDRDYYTRQDPDSVKLRDAFHAHLVRAFVLLGDSSERAEKDADIVLRIETQLAEASKTAVELRDPSANYHKLTLAELQKLAPHFLWNRYLRTRQVTLDTLDVGQPAFFAAMDRLLLDIPIDEWKVYFRYHLLNASASYLSKPYDVEFFSFYGQTLWGSKEQHERWRRVLNRVSDSIDQAVGQLYIRDNFPAASKQRMLGLIGNLRSSLRDRLNQLSWMDEPTRKAALIKLDHLGVKVGYPDKWINYSALTLSENNYLENVFHAAAFNTHRDLAKIGHPVDRQEWDAAPQVVNAYYSPTMNEIVFPAAILLPPIFDPNASDAENYGAIGAVIGHEMTHGFDDEGRQYDEHGNLREWWTKESAAHFKERSVAIVKQFNEYSPLPGIHINGELTEGENIADLGGLRIAYGAFAKTPSFRQTAAAGSYTPAQLFFFAWAAVWRTNTRPETLRVEINTDPHSPPEFRVNGPLSNLPAFFEAFNIPEGAPMRRATADRVEIW